MLGAEDILRSRIQPDYSLTVNEVFLGNARAIPETGWNLDLFSAVDPITSEVLDGKSTTLKGCQPGFQIRVLVARLKRA